MILEGVISLKTGIFLAGNSRMQTSRELPSRVMQASGELPSRMQTSEKLPSRVMQTSEELPSRILQAS